VISQSPVRSLPAEPVKKFRLELLKGTVFFFADPSVKTAFSGCDSMID
jgi:hypothetical protein